ncbi:MAG: alpha/beta fold hydrolase [Steroidobacteraceae bacterium]
MKRSRPVYWSQATEAAVRERYRAMLDAWRGDQDERRIPTSQGETFVITAGAAQSPAVVLLPGSMATSAMWLGTMPALADRFRVIAVDLIGDAGFSATSRPAMKSDAHARWLDDVLDALQVPAASLVGASFGGWLALDYALRRRGRVERLALLAPAGVGRIRPGFMLRTAPLLFLGAWGHRKALGFDMGRAARGDRPDEVAFTALFDTVRSGFIARMQAIPVFRDADLRRLDMPLLAVVGDQDLVFDSRETQARIRAHAKRAEVMMLAGAGHGLIDCTAIIRGFLVS